MRGPWLPVVPGTVLGYHRSPEGPRHVVGVPAGFTNVDRKGGGPMAQQPEGHQNTKADRVYNKVRWLGPIYTIYKIVREALGH